MKRIGRMMAAAGCVSVAVVLSGCGERKAAGRPAYRDLPGTAVLATACGEAFTKADLEAQIDLREALVRQRKPNLNEVDRGRIRQMLMPTALKSFADERALVAYAKREGIAATDEDRRTVEGKIVRKFLRRPGGFSELKALLEPGQAKLLEEGVRRQVLAGKARRALTDGIAPVTADDIRARRREMIAYNTRACATNNAIRAMAAEAHEMIVRTGSFAQVGELYAMRPHVSYDASWGPFERVALTNDPQVVEWLQFAPLKTFSKPIEGDNGLMILKLEQKLPPDPAGGFKTARYLFSRIFFELPGFWDAHETDEQIGRNIESARRTEIYRRRMEAVRKSADVRFPYGEDYFTAKKGK